MSLVKIRGVIIKQSDYGEGNRILNIFTKEQGIIRAVLYGAKSPKNRNGAPAQFLTYADFMLSNSGRDMFTVRSCEPIECFFAIQEDIEKLALCSYFADLSYTLINLNSADENMLNLLLNCFYALAYKDIDKEKIKAVFELRAAAYAGYMPNLYRCTRCLSNDNITAFSPKNGGIVCSDCASAEDFAINAGIYHALRYILTSEEKKMLSFTASEQVMKSVSDIAEKYILLHTEKSFKSLEYYKKISVKAK